MIEVDVPPLRVFVSAGEVSGDIVAGQLINALRTAAPTTMFDGIGGPRMAQAGASLVASANHLGVVGISEGATRVPSAIRVFFKVRAHCQRSRPDVAVLIGNDVFNVILGRQLRSMGIITIALFPPQTWIWEAVINVIAPSLDVVLASFPDEVRCYGQAGVATEFVGHYLADVLPPATPDDRAEARRSLGLSHSERVVGLLPGSRREEIARLLPVLLMTADCIRTSRPDTGVIAAFSPSAKEVAAARTPGGYSVRVVSDSHSLMRAADVVVACSGTATLEASLIGVPLVIAYRSSWITYKIVRAAIRKGLLPGETVGIPNLLLGRSVVPEFVQHRLTAPSLANAVLALIAEDGPREAMREALREVRAQVARPGTLAGAATTILERARLARAGC